MTLMMMMMMMMMTDVIKEIEYTLETMTEFRTHPVIKILLISKNFLVITR